MTRTIHFAPNEFYHIYNRGTDKRDIFLSKGNYNRFTTLLFACNGTQTVDLKLQGRTLYDLNIQKSKRLVDICAYCLLPNHFHLLVREIDDGGISKFMQKLMTAYTMYFNKMNERTGALFQGKFKATYVDDDEYLSYLISYIHLNPVKIIDPLWKENGIRDEQKTMKYLEQYPYSSYMDYIGVNRLENKIITQNAFPSDIATPQDFQDTIRFWLNYNTLENLQGRTL